MSPTNAYLVLNRNFFLGACPTTNSPSLGKGAAKDVRDPSSSLVLLIKIFQDPSTLKKPRAL